MKNVITLVLLLVSLTLAAQKTDKPDFTYQLNGKFEIMKLTDAGVLLVAGSGGLAGIKPEAQKPHFEFTEYGGVKEEEIELVPMSPYVIISQGGKSQTPGTIFANSKRSVIDIVTGKKLFATEDKGWKQIAQLKVFLPENKLVVVGNRAKSEKEVLAVGIYDLATGNQDGFASLDPNAGKTRSAAAIPMSSGAPFMVGSIVLVPTTKSLVCADFKNGNILWEADVNKITWMVADETGKEIYGFEERPNGDTRIHKVSDKGQLLWKDERKIKGTVTRFEILPNGLAVVADVNKNASSATLNRLMAGASESKISFLSAATGEDLWEKAPKTKDFVQHFYIMEDGILFGLAGGGINKISFDGQPLFKKPLTTGENIHTMARTPKGLIYITDTDANIVNLQTGESVWSKPIKYAKAKSVTSTYDAKNKRYLISTGTEILAIDENSGDLSTLARYEFNEKEYPTGFSTRTGGLLLTADQNVMLLDFDGSEAFHAYHKSPGQSGIMKVAMGTLGAAAVVVAASSAVKAGANKNSLGDYNSAGYQAKLAQDAFSDIASVSFNEMNKRFKATAATENAQFILTNLDGGVGLVKVSKDTGNVEKEIVLKDKKPEYQVDEWGGMLYYKSKPNEILAFKL